MKFLLGLLCGLILGGGAYALGPDMPGQQWQHSGQQPLGMPQPFMDIETGQIRQMMPLNPRSPC